MPRLTIRRMVTEDLGYCCLWFFLSRFQNDTKIGLRLGVSRQAVDQARQRCGTCEKRPGCLHAKITYARTPRKRRGDPDEA